MRGLALHLWACAALAGLCRGSQLRSRSAARGLNISAATQLRAASDVTSRSFAGTLLGKQEPEVPTIETSCGGLLGSIANFASWDPAWGTANVRLMMCYDDWRIMYVRPMDSVYANMDSYPFWVVTGFPNSTIEEPYYMPDSYFAYPATRFTVADMAPCPLCEHGYFQWSMTDYTTGQNPGIPCGYDGAPEKP